MPEPSSVKKLADALGVIHSILLESGIPVTLAIPRARAGLTQPEAAAREGVSRSTWTRG
ncbi:MAG: hypothetical protein ACRDT6_05180 [Micromonosporaceae bacterium]